jgi:hypothetical protein
MSAHRFTSTNGSQGGVSRRTFVKGLAVGGVAAGLGLWRATALAQGITPAAWTVEDTIMKRLFAIVLALAVLALGSGARLIAHEGHEHKLMGTVTMAAADHVMLKDKDGKDVMVKVTKDTKVKAKPAVKVQDIKVGSRIVVTAVEEKDKSMTAKSIEVGAVPAATK